MKKRLIALLLAVVVVLSVFAFVGCSKEAAPADDKADTPSKDDGSKAEEEKEEAPEAGSDDVVQLTWIMGYTTIPNDVAMVEEKLDELSSKAIGITCHTNYKDDEGCKLALTSGEDWDIAFTCEWYNNFAVQALAGYFYDISEKVKTVTPDLYATMPDIVWAGGYIGDALYAIPVQKDYAAMMYWRFDKALVDELGLDYENATTFESIGPYLEKIKAARPDEYPLLLASAGPSCDACYDMINRDAALGIPYSAQGGPDENKIVCTFFHEDLINRFKLMNEWYNAGYINPDADVLTDVPVYSAIKSGQGFYGADAIWTNNDGYEQVITMYSGPYLSTASVRGAMNAIAADTDKVDEALKYMEYVCTNQEYTSILRYGIEGYHWNKTDAGTAVVTDEGRNGYVPWAFSQGNYTVSVVADPSPADMWDHVLEDMSSAIGTNGMGFAFNIDPVQNEVAACKIVYDKYQISFNVGAVVDFDTTLAACQAEFEAAGIEKVIAECQAQFDEYVG